MTGSALNFSENLSEWFDNDFEKMTEKMRVISGNRIMLISLAPSSVKSAQLYRARDVVTI